MEARFEFRVWHKTKQHMYLNVAVGVGDNRIGYKMSGKKRYTWEETRNIVVNQYTGYKDSKGEQIFGGDILEFGKNKDYILSVHWQNYQYLFKKKGASKLIDKFKNWKKVNRVQVIGNIYENPELC